MTFKEELTKLINRQSKENASGTPDFILAQFLSASLMAYESAVISRAEWYGEPVRQAGAKVGV